MLDYLTKFNALPQYLKDKMSAPDVLDAVKDLELKYDISLAAVVMKIMVKDVSILDLAKYFVFEYNLDGKKAEELVNEMKEKVLFVAADYLGFEAKRKDIIGIEQKTSEAVNKVKTSNFFFSSEDEEEVSQLTQKLGPKDKIKEVNDEKINSMVDEVVFETGVSFSSEALSERFMKVLKTYARGVRNRLDTKIALGKGADKGGLGMSDSRVEEVLKALDKRNKKRENELPKLELKDDSLETDLPKNSIPKKENIEKFREKISKLSGDEHPDTTYDFSAATKKVLSDPTLKEKLNKKKPELSLEKENKANTKDIVVGTEKKLDEHIAGKDGKFKSRVLVPEGGRKKVEDVKVVPRLTGPIEELRNMNIVDFRRLDADPIRAAAKIKEKIDLLQDDGFVKKLEGISAWRQSKINREYIDVGRKSIGQKKPINDVIHDKNISGHDTLREEEFEAILNLNREIRF